MSDSVGGVNASIPLQAGRGVPQNPLASNPAAFAQTLNAFNQLKLFPLVQQQRQLDIQRGQTALQDANLALLQHKVGVFNGAMAPLIRLGPNVTPSQIMQTVAGLHDAGFPTDAFVADMAQTMPVLDPSEASDPKARAQYGQQLHDWVLNHAARTWDPGTQASAFRPNVAMVDTGGQIKPVDVNAYTNPGIANAPPMAKTLTPGQVVQQVPGPVNGQGQPTVIPQGQYATQAGYGNEVAGAPQAAPQGGGSAFPNGGRIAPPPNAVQPGQPMPTALGPGQHQALAEAGAVGGKQVADLYTAAQDVPARQAMLTAMLGDLSRASTGPNTKLYSDMMGRFVQLGLATPAQAEGQAARENFAKMSSQFAQLQARQLGVITNDKLATALASNPNEVFTTLGNQGVVHIFQGNEDALGAKAQAWDQAQRQGWTPDQYPQWTQQFNQHFDPRAFWLERMSPSERATLLNGMSAADQAKFQRNVSYALSQGWIDPAALGLKGAGNGR